MALPPVGAAPGSPEPVQWNPIYVALVDFVSDIFGSWFLARRAEKSAAEAKLLQETLLREGNPPSPATLRCRMGSRIRSPAPRTSEPH